MDRNQHGHVHSLDQSTMLRFINGNQDRRSILRKQVKNGYVHCRAGVPACRAGSSTNAWPTREFLWWLGLGDTNRPTPREQYWAEPLESGHGADATVDWSELI